MTVGHGPSTAETGRFAVRTRPWAEVKKRAGVGRPKINEVEAFLDGDEELFQADVNKPGPFLQPADMTGPLTVQLLDSQGNVVAQVPVYNVNMSTSAGGRIDLKIEASFHHF